MTDPNSQNPQPSEIPKPPAIIPKPDIKDPRKSGPTYGANPEETKGKKKKKSKERTHPTDPYAPLPKRRGCFGCGGCLGGLAILLLLLVGGIAAGYVTVGPGRFVSDGYTIVNLKESDAVIDTAPETATVFLAPGTLRYQVPLTKVPVAIFAREITGEGDFYEDVSLNAVKVTATVKARFAKNLEVNAAEFTDEGLTLKGELSGRVIRNRP